MSTAPKLIIYSPINMKTIFITVQLGAEIKNWFLGDFYKLCKENPEVKLVVFTHAETLEKYRQQFWHERCTFEILPDLKLGQRKAKMYFRILSFASLPTSAALFRLKYFYLNGGSYLMFFAKRLIWLLGHTRIWRSLIRLTEFYFFRDEGAWREYFERYQPDVVFAPTTYRDADVTMIKYAKRHGVPAVGMLRGWDNMSSKAFLTAHPDILLVQNPTMVEEAVNWNDVARERVKIIGFPYFDHYVDPSWQMSREEVAKAIGVDPSKKWIGYFVGGLFVGFLRAGDGEWHARLLDKIAGSGELGNVHVVASIHPGDRGDKVKWDDKKIGDHIQVMRLAKGWNFTGDMMKIIMNFVRECAVTVDFGSSLSLEAAIFDRPLIFIGFNGPEGQNVAWHKRISVAYRYYTHVKYLVDAGGVWEVADEKELVRALKTYLQDPSLHREGRKRIVERLVGPLDGKAGKRAFETIMSLM